MNKSTRQSARSQSGEDTSRGLDDELFRDAESASAENERRGRRRFLRGAGTTGLVAFTIMGRPAWANGCSLSARMSGNTSAHGAEEMCMGEGRSAGFWRNRRLDWHDEFPPSMMFVTAFGVDAFPGKNLFDVISFRDDGEHGRDRFASITIADDMSEYSRDEIKSLARKQAKRDKVVRVLGMQSVAALQNAATGIRYELTVGEVQASFQSAYRSGNVRRMQVACDSLEGLITSSGTPS